MIVTVLPEHAAALGLGVTGDAILEAVASIGHAIGASVLAEGIETAEYHERVQRLGCGYGQGWHFGRPMSADEFSARIDALANPVDAGVEGTLLMPIMSRPDRLTARSPRMTRLSPNGRRGPRLNRRTAFGDSHAVVGHARGTLCAARAAQDNERSRT